MEIADMTKNRLAIIIITADAVLILGWVAYLWAK
jgi:hypothetical protein